VNPISGISSDVFGAIVRGMTDAAISASKSMVDALGASTEPNLDIIVPTYNRMLALSLLLAGAMIVFALIERTMGGPKGAGLALVPRTIFALIGAFFGLTALRHLVEVGNAMGTMWTSDIAGNGSHDATALAATLSDPNFALMASALSFWIALFTMLLALLIYLELLVRSALILTTATMIPLVCAFSIWPRFSVLLRHMSEFLVTLLLTKFVVVTTIDIGLTMMAKSPPQGALGPVLMGIAVLVMAAFSPAALMQGVKYAEASTSGLVRGWVAGAVGIAGTAAGVALGGSTGLAVAGGTNLSKGGGMYLAHLISRRGGGSAQAPSRPAPSAPESPA
jgi:hypothetical protein